MGSSEPPSHPSHPFLFKARLEGSVFLRHHRPRGSLPGDEDAEPPTGVRSGAELSLQNLDVGGLGFGFASAAARGRKVAD